MHGMPSGSNPFLGGERHKMKNVAQNIDPGVVVVVVRKSCPLGVPFPYELMQIRGPFSRSQNEI